MIGEKELGEIGFHPYSVKILQSLGKGRKTAKQISQEKGIPLGRIYDFLNDLIGKRIIDQTVTNPTYYYAENLERKIISNLDRDYLRAGEEQERLLDMLETEALEAEPISSSQAFDEMVNRDTAGSSAVIKAIRRDVSYPFFLYPEGLRQTVELRNIIYNKKGDYSPEDIRRVEEKREIQLRNFNDKNTQIMFSEFSFSYFFNKIRKRFGAGFALEHLKKVKVCVKGIRTFELRISRERFPYHLFITDGAVVLAIKEEHEEERNLMGTRMHGGGIVKNYETMFDSKFENAEPFETYYERLLKNIKTQKSLI